MKEQQCLVTTARSTVLKELEATPAPVREEAHNGLVRSAEGKMGRHVPSPPGGLLRASQQETLFQERLAGSVGVAFDS